MWVLVDFILVPVPLMVIFFFALKWRIRLPLRVRSSLNSLRSLNVITQVIPGKFLISDHSVSLYRILPHYIHEFEMEFTIPLCMRIYKYLALRR